MYDYTNTCTNTCSIKILVYVNWLNFETRYITYMYKCYLFEKVRPSTVKYLTKPCAKIRLFKCKDKIRKICH